MNRTEKEGIDKNRNMLDSTTDNVSMLEKWEESGLACEANIILLLEHMHQFFPITSFFISHFCIPPPMHPAVPGSLPKEL